MVLFLAYFVVYTWFYWFWDFLHSLFRMTVSFKTIPFRRPMLKVKRNKGKIELEQSSNQRTAGRCCKIVCARYGVLLEGESPLHTRQGEVLAEGKGVVVRRGLKKAYKQSAGPTNRNHILGVGAG